MVHAPGLPSSEDECVRWWSFLCLSREIQQSWWHHQRTHLSSSQCHSEDCHQTRPRSDQVSIEYANLCPWQTLCPSMSGESHGQPSLTSPLPNGRLYQWANLVQYLSPNPVKPPFVHSTHPICWQSSDLRWQTPHRTGTLWSSSRRWILRQTHHPRDWTGPGISGVYARNQTFGADLSRTNQYFSSSLTLFSFSSSCPSEWLPLTLSHCHQGCFPSFSSSTRFDPVNSFIHSRWVSQGGTPDSFWPTLDSASEPPIAASNRGFLLACPRFDVVSWLCLASLVLVSFSLLGCVFFSFSSFLCWFSLWFLWQLLGSTSLALSFLRWHSSWWIMLKLAPSITTWLGLWCIWTIWRGSFPFSSPPLNGRTLCLLKIFVLKTWDHAACTPSFLCLPRQLHQHW